MNILIILAAMVFGAVVGSALVIVLGALRAGSDADDAYLALLHADDAPEDAAQN